MAEERLPSEEEFLMLLEDRTFVDYFNVFLSLPVFGQHVFYNYHECYFEYEPPLRRRKHYLDVREVIYWLLENRYRIFLQSPLYIEYLLSTQIRGVDVDRDTHEIIEEIEGSNERSILGRVLLGHATGMMLFREAMRGTCGEKVFRCWKDIEMLRHTHNDEKQARALVHYIKMTYISSQSSDGLSTHCKTKAFQGTLNFDLTPDKEIEETLTHSLVSDNALVPVNSVDALFNLQQLLLVVLRRYWVPRFILHVLKTTPDDVIERLCQCSVGDLEDERKTRCNYLFPEMDVDAKESPAQTTPVFLSTHAKDLPISCSPSDSSCSSEQERPADPSDLLSLCGGGLFPRSHIEMMQRLRNIKAVSEESQSSTISASSLLSSPSNGQNAVANSHSAAGDGVIPTPIHIRSYLNGRRRLGQEQIAGSNNKVLCALASDNLGGAPFRQFLINTEQTLDLHYLDFWRDIRRYLDAEENSIDKYGNPLRKMLAHMIAERYLSSSGEESDIFSEGLKMQILYTLSNENDVSLLCVVQDIVTGALQDPWKMFINQERSDFANQVCGKRQTTKMNRGTPSVSSVSENTGVAEPLYFAQVSNFRIGSGSGTNRMTPNSRIDSALGARSGCTELTSQLSEFLVVLTQEQIVRAFELSLLCEEYGAAGMVPISLPSIESLIDNMYSDFGSLHVSRDRVIKQKELREMIFPPKINIEKIDVSRKVMIGSKKTNPGIQEESMPRCARLVMRRNGVLIERPPRPKNFLDALTNHIHFDFFKRFMAVHKASAPLNFWKEVEDLRDTAKPKIRVQKVTQIFRRYFSRAAKYGRHLDCSDELIRQIPMMEKVTASIMVCAQASVYRAMERKWYPRYLETYPIDVELNKSKTILKAATPVFDDPTTHERPPKLRRYPKKKTLQYWHCFISAVIDFLRALKRPAEVKLLEMFLKTESDRDATGGQDKSLLSSTMAAIQTRVVMKNRLVVVNRLLNDLNFWIEVQMYKSQVDSVASLPNITKEDTDQLGEKAKAIIHMFLSSAIPPKVQVNIPNDLAATITNNLSVTGPVRGLFHDATFLLFPLLYHYWRKFENHWLKNQTSDELLAKLETKLNPRERSPHCSQTKPTYTHTSWSDFRVTAGPMTEEDRFRINFSIMTGIRLIYPHRKGTKNLQLDYKSSRVSSNSLLQMNSFESPPKKHDYNSRRTTTHESRTSLASLSPPVTMNGPRFDKARRLSKLVEDINFMNRDRQVNKYKTLGEVVKAALHVSRGTEPTGASVFNW